MSFTQLPFLPLFQVFGSLDDLDMLHLSFCSRRMTKLIKVSKRFTSNSIRYEIHNDSFEISFVINSRFMISVEPSSRRMETPKVGFGSEASRGTIRFRGFEMRSFKPQRCSYDPSSVIFYNTKDDFLVLHDALTTYLLDVHVEPPQFELRLEPSQILTYPFLKNWRKWEKVTVTNYSTGRSYVTMEEMQFLNDSRYTEALRFFKDVGDRLQYSEGLKMRKINFIYSSWLHFDSIINSESEEITLYRFPRPMASQLINLVKLWVAKKKMVNLKWLQMDFDTMDLAEDVRLDFQREVFHGIGLSVPDDVETGDVSRVDGATARIDFKYSVFYFYVLRNE